MNKTIVSFKEYTQPVVGFPIDIFIKAFDEAGNPKACEVFYTNIVGSYALSNYLISDNMKSADGSLQGKVTFNKPGLNTVNIGAGAFAYYASSAYSASHVLSKSWKKIDFDWGNDVPNELRVLSKKSDNLASSQFTVEWFGYLRAPYSEDFKF
jgi:hypothetical protein